MLIIRPRWLSENKEIMNAAEHNQIISELAIGVLERMDFHCAVVVSPHPQDASLRVVEVTSNEELGRLIGKNGQNIFALEQLLKLLVAKKITDSPNLMLDINGYRKVRAKQLADLALAAAERVRTTKKAEALEPMTGYERRLVHMELAPYPDIETASIGEEPQRRVVIKPLLL